jgi:hypothetical protein
VLPTSRSGVRTLVSLASLLGVTGGCTLAHVPIPVDSSATVAAHQERRGLVVDKLPDGGVGTLRPGAIVKLPGNPDFVLATDASTIGGMWLVAPAHVVVRQGTSKGDPVVGEVTPSWQDDVIRLTLTPSGGKPFRTDPLRREGAGTGRAVFSRTIDANIDLRGTYKATLRDATGAAVGWMRIRIGPYQPSGRIYDADFPADAGSALPVAGFLALDSEVDWIEDHAASMYNGAGTGTPGLERSIPTTR